MPLALFKDLGSKTVFSEELAFIYTLYIFFFPHEERKIPTFFWIVKPKFEERLVSMIIKDLSAQIERKLKA